MRTFLLFLFVGSLLFFSSSLAQVSNKNYSLLSKKDNTSIPFISTTNTTDSIISLAVSQINPDSIRYFIQKLQDFGTRYAYAANHFEVAMWIKNEFERFGNITAELDSFLVDGVWMFNVVATLQGRITPENYVIIGGHYDSYSTTNPMITAPGADDNASGTSAALEVARVITSMNYTPDVTIKFIAFDVEEVGLWGSQHYAELAANQSMNIKIMINNDMIAYTSHILEESQIEIYYRYSKEVRDLGLHYLQTYSVLTPVVIQYWGPDDKYFGDRGYETLFFIEDLMDFNPYYHSPEETIDNLNMDYCAEVIKINAAVLLKVSDMPDKIKDYVVEDVGDGNSIKLSWKSNIEPDVIGYKVSVGVDSSVYDTTFIVTDTVAIVSGLQDGTEYFFGVKAIDSDGNEGFTIEKIMIPNTLPLSPQNFIDYPEWHKTKLSWANNKELDLAGYNIYRSETISGTFTKINQSVIIDSFFVDDNMVLGKYYYYKVKAVDNNQNEGNESTIIRSMAVSLDKGILLVDETKNGTGNLFDPTDAEVDEYYNNILSYFYHNNYDVDITGEIKLADLGAFSTIIWQGNDNTEFTSALSAVDAVKKYLDYGGNVLFTGFSASKSFNGNIGVINSFADGDFIYDYLKVDSSINKLSALFIGAAPKTSSYNHIWVDSSKSSLATNYHLRKVEAISSNSEGTEIYTYNSNYDSTISQGSMRGLPVGVEYLGNDYKTVVLNIPLFYMDEEQSKTLINYILQNKFNELTDIENEVKEIIPSNFVLYQNYPNPFNPSTTIKFALPVKTNLSLSVYNTLGEKVAEIFNGEMEEGYHEMMFNASGLSSGVYFYKIESENFNSTKKLILMK